MLDTAPASQARYFELLREKSPTERLAIAMRLTRSVRKLAEAGVRSRHPNASPTRVQAELAAVFYGDSVAERLFPGARRDAG